jgi:hypothetical protein
MNSGGHPLSDHGSFKLSVVYMPGLVSRKTVITSVEGGKRKKQSC